jgi:transcription elongation factor Elf1
MDKPLENAAREAIIKAAAWLRGLEHVPAAHVDLYEKLALAQWQARRALAPGDVYPGLAADTAAQMLRHGFYLLDFARLNLDAAVLQPLWDELCDIMTAFGELDQRRSTSLRRALEEGRLSLPGLAGIVFRGEAEELGRVARRVRVPRRVLSWLATAQLSPFVSAAAQNLAPHLRALSWPHPYCPVCGHKPLMAVTRREAARREVECSLCATRWEVHRGRCVFCGNEDRESHRFLSYDLDSPYRVDVCDKCGRYIKVVDERKLLADRETLLPAEDIATLYLDELARRKKYLPPWSGEPGSKPKGSERPEEEVVPA